MTGLTVYNEIIGILAGLVTTFLIPWLNKKLHVNIPDGPNTAQKLQDVLDNLVKHSEPPPPPAPVIDLGPNPFTSAPEQPPTNNATPPENGAK